MKPRETVGKAIATAYEKDPKDIPEYEFPDSGHVELNLTASDIAALEGLPSEPDIRSRTKSSTSLIQLSAKNKNIVQIRLLATMAVLLSSGFVCILLNCLARYATMQDSEMVQVTIGILAFTVAVLTRDWYLLHGEKLTRALKALLNVSSMLHSFDTFSLDFFGIGKHLKFNGKYIFTPEGPAINEAIPRTPESSPPVSPSGRKK